MPDARAAADAIDRRALSTTLILAAVRRVESGIFTAALEIGDGDAGIVDLADGALVTLTAPDGGGYAGRTRFLDVAACDEARAHIEIRADFYALLLMADGITDPHLPTQAAFGDFASWLTLCQPITDAVDFRSSAAADQLLA